MVQLYLTVCLANRLVRENEMLFCGFTTSFVVFPSNCSALCFYED